MSVKNVREFFKKVETDKTLQEKLKALDKKAKEAMDAVFLEVVELGGREGFEFTVQDFVDIRNERPTPGEVENENRVHSRGPITEPGCAIAYGCGYNHPMWSLEEPPPPCGQGQAYIPHGYGH